MAKITSIGLTGLCLLVQFGAEAHESSWFKEQHQCMALNMYWEARGEGSDGMIAVGWTVLNRMRSRRLALLLAERMLVAPPSDPTGGSLYYHSTSVRPGWKHARTTRIGRHVFFR